MALSSIAGASCRLPHDPGHRRRGTCVPGLGALKRVLLRVVAGAAFATMAFEVGEHVMKPLVQERFGGPLSFPSGHVTAVCATALAMWIALYSVLGQSTHVITFAVGAAWTLLMSVAVVGRVVAHAAGRLSGPFSFPSASSLREPQSSGRRGGRRHLPSETEPERVTAAV